MPFSDSASEGSGRESIIAQQQKDTTTMKVRRYKRKERSIRFEEDEKLKEQYKWIVVEKKGIYTLIHAHVHLSHLTSELSPHQEPCQAACPLWNWCMNPQRKIPRSMMKLRLLGMVKWEKNCPCLFINNIILTLFLCQHNFQVTISCSAWWVGIRWVMGRYQAGNGWVISIKICHR